MCIENLIKKIKTIPDCVVYPPNGLPVVEEGFVLPSDVKDFYHLCGGVKLFTKNIYSISIVSPNDFLLANPIIVGERGEYDISSNWYIVASDFNGDYLTIDLHQERLGRCYDSFWDRHGVADNCPIISLTFTDLLVQLINNKGNRWYWLQDDFISLGDAYDSVIE